MSRQHHYLKKLPKYFVPIERGIKNFEVRFNDRGYKIGDILHLKEFADGEFTGRVITKEVCYILDEPEYCKKGYVILGMK